jgi:hypothetical protein
MMDSIYGGRVDNPFDQRVLKCYLDKYFNDKLIGGRGQIMKGVYVPSSNAAGDYHDSISKIPEVDAPEVFSLPANIERSVQRARSAVVIEKLGMMSSAGLGVGGEFGGAKRSDMTRWEKLQRNDACVCYFFNRACSSQTIILTLPTHHYRRL